MIGDPKGGGARMVHFCADYVFTNRRFSEAWLMVLAAEAPRNGRVTHPEQCRFCLGWMEDQAVWTCTDGRGWVQFACSPMCSAKVSARYLSREAQC